MPSVKSWNGTYYVHRDRKFKGWSFALGYSEIKLAKRHRSIQVLLHELVHTMGFGTHGRSFVKKYIELLVAYGGMEEGEIVIGMGMFGIQSV